jgi:hypothetical protein
MKRTTFYILLALGGALLASIGGAYYDHSRLIWGELR